MKFKTITSEYEITADSFGIMTLEKLSTSPYYHSKIQTGRKFFARRGDAIILKQGDLIHLNLTRWEQVISQIIKNLKNG